MTYFITIAGRRWPVEVTFKTGKDTLGWDTSQARTYDEYLLDTADCRRSGPPPSAPPSLAPPFAVAGGDLAAAARPPSGPRPADLHRQRAAARPRLSPARPASPRSGCPPPCPPLPPRPRPESRAHQPRPPRLPSPLVTLAATPPGPRPLAPLQHPHGSPRHLSHHDRKEVTPSNQQHGSHEP